MKPLFAAAMLAAFAIPVHAGSLGLLAVLVAAQGEESPAEAGTELTVVPRPKGLAGELALDRSPAEGLCASRFDGIEWVADELYADEAVAVLQYRVEAGETAATAAAAVEVEGGLRLRPGDSLFLLERLSEEPCLSREGGSRYYKFLAEVRTPEES